MTEIYEVSDALRDVKGAAAALTALAIASEDSRVTYDAELFVVLSGTLHKAARLLSESLGEAV